MPEREITVLDRFSTSAGLTFAVRDGHHYQVGQTVRYRGVRYTITEISTNSSLNLTALRVIRA